MVNMSTRGLQKLVSHDKGATCMYPELLWMQCGMGEHVFGSVSSWRVLPLITEQSMKAHHSDALPDAYATGPAAPLVTSDCNDALSSLNDLRKPLANQIWGQRLQRLRQCSRVTRTNVRGSLPRPANEQQLVNLL